jgi:ketosteroid isomerase-like protein
MDTDLTALAREWVAAWNARDLDRVLALYTEEATMASPYIRSMNLSETGRLHGKDALRAYWGKALPNHPDLHFDLKAIYAGPNSVVIHYRNDRGAEVCEYLRVDESGEIIEGAAHHMPDAST